MISCVWFNLLNLLLALNRGYMVWICRQTPHKGNAFCANSLFKEEMLNGCQRKWHLNVPCTVHDGEVFCVLKHATILLPAYLYMNPPEKKMKLRSSQDSDLGFWISVRCLGHWSSAGLKDRWCSSTHIGSSAQRMNIRKKNTYSYCYLMSNNVKSFGTLQWSRSHCSTYHIQIERCPENLSVG